MVSAMGDAEGKGKGGFVLLDEDFKVLRFIVRRQCITVLLLPQTKPS